MEAGFKHPKVYADLVTFYAVFWPIHQALPRGFRYTSGEQILEEITTCIRAVIHANFSDKKCSKGRQLAAKKFTRCTCFARGSSGVVYAGLAVALVVPWCIGLAQ